jgi:HEAT repeat protein
MPNDRRRSADLTDYAPSMPQGHAFLTIVDAACLDDVQRRGCDDTDMTRKQIVSTGALLGGLLALGLLAARSRLGWWSQAWDALERAGWLEPEPASQVVGGVAGAVLGGLLAFFGMWWVAWWQQRRTSRDQQVRQAEQGRRDAVQTETAWEQRCRDLLVRWPPPKVREASPYELNTLVSRLAEQYRSPAASRPPYVRRAQHDDLARCFATGLVLVLGGSRAGKSRLAFEVAAEVIGDYLLIVPRTRHGDSGPPDPKLSRANIRELARLYPPPWGDQPAVIWLDELEHFLGIGTEAGLDDELLTAWRAAQPPIVVVATARDEALGPLRALPGDWVAKTLNRFELGRVRLPVEFDDPTEQAQIAEHYPGEGGVRCFAQHLAGVPELVERLEGARSAFPAGYAVVLAAVDWRRAGLDRPGTAEDLLPIAEAYLDQLPEVAPQRISAHKQDLPRALPWASELINGTAALLDHWQRRPNGLDEYRATDPIVDHVTSQLGQRLSTPAAWQWILHRVAVREKVRVAAAARWLGAPEAAGQALAAVLRDADQTVAHQVALALQDSDDLNVTPGLASLTNLRLLSHPKSSVVQKAAKRLAELDPDTASAAFQRMLEHPNPQVVSDAARRLAELDPDVARPAFHRLLEHPDAWVVLTVAARLADVDPDNARPALQRLLDHADHSVALEAADRLAELDPDTASATFQRLLDRSDSSPAIQALWRLMELDPDAGSAAVQRLLEHSDSTIVYLAANQLDELDPDVARPALQRLLGHPDSLVALEAARQLAKLDPDAGKAALQRLLDHPFSEVVRVATLELAELDPDAARPALQRLFEHPDPWIVINTAWSLSVRDPDAAHSAFQRLLGDPSPTVRLVAAQYLADRDPDIARPVLQRLLDHPDYSVARGAADSLVRLDPDTASTALQRLLQHPEPVAVLGAIHQLAELDPDIARSAFHSVLGHPHPAIVREAAARLADLDPDNAGPALQRLLDHPDSSVVREAAARLADVAPDGAGPALQRLLQHPDPSVVLSAAEQLARLEPDEARPAGSD